MVIYICVKNCAYNTFRWFHRSKLTIICLLMITVYAMSRNIQTPQNLLDHPCHTCYLKPDCFTYLELRLLFFLKMYGTCWRTAPISRRLRVVPLSLRPSCVTLSLLCVTKKWPREILGARSTHACRPQDFTRPFFSHFFFSRHARRTKRKRDCS